MERITSVRFLRYKAFRDFSLSLDSFNVLVGPNNSGKSTILGAFRILSEGLRKARSRNPSVVTGPSGADTRGYELSLRDIPVATENVFHNYEEDQPAVIRFRVSSGDYLVLVFPERGLCNLVCETTGRAITSPSLFRRHFDVDIGFVPILGPVEHNEPLYQREAAREALLTHRASRNFRNIWHHYPEGFDEFRNRIQTTWPGMDIKPPEVDISHEKPLLRMFCPEDRIDRELFWAGFGFQVWCQMLTFIVRHTGTSLFIIDEPDIYLHSDLQRQLVTLLRHLGPDILLATHSTEIIAEAEPNEILVVTKRAQSAKKVTDLSQLRGIFNTLGSNLNPTLTQVARTRRIVYVEGKDFQIISRFAGKLGYSRVANRSHFAVVATEGFNPTRVRMFTEGVNATLDSTVATAVVFDRDYRSDEELDAERIELNRVSKYAHIHTRKELENFLLVPSALERAIVKRVAEQNRRTGRSTVFSERLEGILLSLTDTMKYDVQAEFLKRRVPFMRGRSKGIDDTTLTREVLALFDEQWNALDRRLELVPGKELLSKLNGHLQDSLGVAVTPHLIIEAMQQSEVPQEIKVIVASLDSFTREPI
jgi:energy-coupling factor transporter ATP-binding protein EcfA2